MGPRVFRVLVASIGGQGGATISEILHKAVVVERDRYAEENGFYDEVKDRCDLEVRYMLPGLAQRSGSVFSTLTFVDPHTSQLPKATMYFSDKVYSGSLDLLLATELNEAIRYAGRGLLSADSTVIVNEHRLYTAREKIPDNKYVPYPIAQVKVLKKLAARYIGIDGTEIAASNGLPSVTVNTILLGVLSASGALPITRSSYMNALESMFKDEVLEENLKAFTLGEQAYTSRQAGRKEHEHLNIPSGAVTKQYQQPLSTMLAERTERLAERHGTYRAMEYLKLVDKILAVDGGGRLSYELSKNIADRLLMWDDPYVVARKYIELADLYRKRGYYSIKAYVVILPGWISKSLPGRLGTLAARILSRMKFVYPVEVNVSSAAGYALFWFLAKLSMFERRSFGYIERMLEAARISREIIEISMSNYDVAVEAARSLGYVRGYGLTRRRNMLAYRWLLKSARLLASKTQKLGGDCAATTLRALSDVITLDGHGLEMARKLFDAFMEKAEEGRESICVSIPAMAGKNFICK